MKIRGFNLVPGAVVAYAGRENKIVDRIERDSDLELAYGRFADGDPFVVDYNAEVTLMGLSPEGDPQDIGTD